MYIKPVGDDLEAVCCGCGETLLISSGDSVNFRSGGTEEIMGVEVCMPSGLLCSRCDREENKSESLSVVFTKMSCVACDAELSPDGAEPIFDENGVLKGLVCPICLETRRSETWQEG